MSTPPGGTIRDLSSALWREIADTAKVEVGGTASFYGIVTDVADPLVQVRALGDDAPGAGENWYARLAGAALMVGDTVLVHRTSEGTPLVVGKVGGGVIAGGVILVASDDAPDRVKQAAHYVCDGTDDDEVEINAALAALGPEGGTVLLSQGRFFTSASILIDDYQTLAGSGAGATVLFLASAANVPVITVENFATLAGGDTTGGPAFWEVRDLEIDGNVANQSGSRNGHGILVYGRNYRLSRLIIHHCYGLGISSMWSTNASPPSPHSMEARITDVEIHDCDLNAILWQGPHDSIFTRVIPWSNCVANVGGSDRAIHVYSSRANACQFVDCHPWGASHKYGYVIDADDIQIRGGIIEGAALQQVYVNGNACKILDPYIWGANIASVVGVSINGGVTRTHIRAEIVDCPGYCIDLVSDGGKARIDVVCEHASGAAVNGSYHTTTWRTVKVNNGGSGTVNTQGT